MAKVRNSALILTGAFGFIGVAAGGFGTHELAPHITPREQFAWGLAVVMNLLHAVAMLAIFGVLKSVDPDGHIAKHLTRAFYLLAAGTVLFAGSIYAMCLGAPGKKVGPLTPVGGITLMLGWITMPPKEIVATSSQTDPMLQGTYLQDDAVDFVPSSVALDEFDAHLASGQPVHSAQPRCNVHQAHKIIAGHKKQERQAPSRPPHRIPLQGSSVGGTRGLTEEEQERLEEIEAVRHLDDDSGYEDE